MAVDEENLVRVQVDFLLSVRKFNKYALTSYGMNALR